MNKAARINRINKTARIIRISWNTRKVNYFPDNSDSHSSNPVARVSAERNKSKVIFTCARSNPTAAHLRRAQLEFCAFAKSATPLVLRICEKILLTLRKETYMG